MAEARDVTTTTDKSDDEFAKFDFSVSEIPCLHYQSVEAERLISCEKPVVLRDSRVISTAMKWSLDYLEANMGDSKCNVYSSQTGRFKYFDDKKAQTFPGFECPMQLNEMTFDEFVRKVREWKAGDRALYLQQALNDTVKPSIVRDFIGFDWDWLNFHQAKQKWGPLTSNLVLIAMGGNITPAHYDEQHNFFCQVEGRKRCILFHPDQFECLYPHPVSHPCDRQSQVDFDRPDFSRFPKFKHVKGWETIVHPGEILYIPMYWWHYIESAKSDTTTTSITFWYRSGPTPQEITWPLSVEQKIAVTRNIEKMLHDALKNTEEVRELLHMIVDGRYPCERWDHERPFTQ
ncbi:hypoxia-inducible factor 1-alpha inhibitor-like [Corticium candelabrum]|uniref:hypoxia-inducible factor 1-alpha inhibitor-like n=1 Tax=Corticium candelabrum TaxID=121492 RepID=UPI002E344739|nr:hypoxia-inducible factor 1-alpha inhibitor-like [Corticium candelabrum]